MRTLFLATVALTLAACSGVQHMPSGTVMADGSVASVAFNAPVACGPGVTQIPRSGWAFPSMIRC